MKQGETMNNQEFATRLFVIFEDRGLSLPSIDWVKSLFERCKEVPDKDLSGGFNKVMDIPAVEWNKNYGFGGKPPISEWVGFLTGQKTKSIDTIAALEVARILDYASYYYGNSVWFDNPTTNACVEVYGGIGKIAWAIDETNDNKEDGKWIAKNLKEIWLQCYDGKKERTQPCLGRSKPKIFHKGELIDQPIKIDFVGDKTKYIAIEENPKETNIILLPTLPTFKKI